MVQCGFIVGITGTKTCVPTFRRNFYPDEGGGLHRITHSATERVLSLKQLSNACLQCATLQKESPVGHETSEHGRFGSHLCSKQNSVIIDVDVMTALSFDDGVP
jgi:hypothetical protein